MTYVSSEDIFINTTRENSQNNLQFAALAGGGWVASWDTYTDQGDQNVMMKVYNADGTVRIDEALVNTTTAGDQNNAVVVALPNGGWTIAWESHNASNYNNSRIYYQMFDVDGSHAGNDSFPVNEMWASAQNVTDATNISFAPISNAAGSDAACVLTYQAGGDTYYVAVDVTFNQNGVPTIGGKNGALISYFTGVQENAKVIGTNSGGFVAIFETDQNSHDVNIVAFDSNFNRMAGYGTEDDHSVTSDSSAEGYYQGQPAITALEGGGWVVGWATLDSNTSQAYYRQRVFAADGTAAQSTSAIDSDLSKDDTDLNFTAINGGGYVATWVEQNTTNSAEIYQRLFDSAGNQVGDRVHVNTTTENTQNAPQVTALTNGGWVTVWRSFDQTPNTAGHSYYLQVFDSTGAKQGDETLIHTDTDDTAHYAPKVTALQRGGFVVGWTAYNADGGYDVMQKVFTVLNEAPAGANGSFTVVEDNAFTFDAANFSFTDTNGDSLAAVIITGLPATGTLKLNGVAVTANQEISVDDITDLVWTPPANRSGNGLATISFKVKDDGGTTGGGINTDATANHLTFNVTPVVDVILGNGDPNTLNGTNEDDILKGLAGDDKLNGKGGKDRMEGGTEDDTYAVDNSGDTVVEKKTEGTDKVIAGLTFALAANVENLTLTGIGDFKGTGNWLANILMGNKGLNRLEGLGGNDTLRAGDGNDFLIGGTGIDTMAGGTGKDVFIFNAASESGKGAKADHITDFVQVQDDVDLSALAGTVTWLGLKSFTGAANQLKYQVIAGDAVVSLDINGDKVADMQIVLDNVTKLAKTDFLL